jgi:hypothetical protein
VARLGDAPGSKHRLARLAKMQLLGNAGNCLLAKDKQNPVLKKNYEQVLELD